MIVVAAHGTRDPAGPAVIEALADGVRAALPGEAVRVAYADVRVPSVADVLSEHLGERAVVVPAFLAAGYHVRTDIPQQIATSGHPRTVLADAFGPAPELVAVLIERLVDGGYRTGDGVVLAAAGSSDPRALVDVHDATYALSVRLGAPVRIGFAATARPSVSDAVASLRAARPDVPVAVASWLLAPGLFQRRLDDAGADVTANPLGAHPRVVDLIIRRYQAAVGAFVAA
ncbi:sirohydrochlorin chelatase [Haloechinothrix halophila]|uniref:sirohydrochlorin chelatase n=1 Tax=Haloechinothrix halophila TaxID=1069073 RepID=UPI000405ED50|nr:sirohydrochlorin chelatase [Haloechinothrix halophila]